MFGCKVKNVILITYSFPPDKNIGAIRPRGLAKYLPHYDWNVFVITPLSLLPRDPEFNVIETYPSFRQKLGYLKTKSVFDHNRVLFRPPLYLRFFFGFLELIPFPDSKSGWIYPAVYSGTKLTSQKQVNAIISTYSPASSHFIAYKLKKMFPHTTWIADFRDLWSHNPFRKLGRFGVILFEKIEKRILCDANFITTVSEPLAFELKRLHEKKTVVIPNGFDPEEYDFTIGLDAKFSIIYTGSLYHQQRNPEILFMIIKKIFSEDNSARYDFRVHFFGNFSEELQTLIRKYSLEEIVKQEGFLPRKDVLKKQKSAQILLLLNRNLPQDIGVYTGKLFEYFGAKRPILAIGYKDSVVKDILEETKAGVYCYQQEQIYQALKNWYFEWKKNKMVKYHGINDKINLYSHKMMAKKFAVLLEEKTSS